MPTLSTPYDGPEPGDRVTFSVGVPDAGSVMSGEGFVTAMEPRNEDLSKAFLFIAVLGIPQTITMPVFCCRVVERGALVRRIALSIE